MTTTTTIIIIIYYLFFNISDMPPPHSCKPAFPSLQVTRQKGSRQDIDKAVSQGRVNFGFARAEEGSPCPHSTAVSRREHYQSTTEIAVKMQDFP